MAMAAISEDIIAQRPPSYGTHDSTETLPTYEAKPKPDGGQLDQEKERTEEAIETAFDSCLDASEIESLVGLDDETIRKAGLQLDISRKRGSQWLLISRWPSLFRYSAPF